MCVFKIIVTVMGSLVCRAKVKMHQVLGSSPDVDYP